MHAAQDEWIEDWLSAPRFAVYLAAAGDDRARAAALYEWNAACSAAFHHDLAHVEVGLRNAYDRALCRGTPPGRPHWVFEPDRFFPPMTQKAVNGRRYDANEKSRKLIAEAIRNASPKPKPGKVESPSAPTPGKVIAELPFGFWRYLSARRQAEPLWVPSLHTAVRSGTARRDVDRPVGRLHDLRNRVAHHEPLIAVDLRNLHQDVLLIARLLSDELATYVSTHSRCPQLLADRPC